MLIIFGKLEGLSRPEKVDDVSRKEGTVPLTPHTKELSPVKDHRYQRRRRKRRKRTVTVMTKIVKEVKALRGVKRRLETKLGRSWGAEGVK